MKKKMLLFFILLASIILLPSFSPVSADSIENSIEFYTIYPESPNKILEYQDLTNISHMTINNDYIAYTTTNTTVTIFEKATRKYYNVENFNNIYSIKYINNNQLLVVDYNSINNEGCIKLITSTSQTNADSLTIVQNTTNQNISLQDLKAIDIYHKNNDVYIGLINNTTFTLYEFKNQLNLSCATNETISEKAFYDASLVAINDNSQLIVYKSGGQAYISILSNSSNTIQDKHTLDTLEEIDLIEYNQTTYLTASISGNIILFTMNDFKTPICNYLLFDSVCDIECIDNQIYIAINENQKLIEYLTLSTQTENSSQLEITLGEVLICSANSDAGRFNGVSDLYIHGNTIYVSDTKNNRIQVIDNNHCYIKDKLELYPKGISVDKNNNIYFTTKLTDNTSSLLVYSFDGKDFTKTAEHKSFDFDSTTLGKVSNTTITSNGELYLIDYTNNKLLYLSNSGLKTKSTLPFTANESTQIQYIKYLNIFAIKQDNKIYLYNIKENELSTPIVITDIKAITSDLNSIYVLQSDRISIIEIENNQMTINNTIAHTKIADLSTISYDIASEKMYGFDSKKQSIVYFDYAENNNPLSFSDFADNTTLNTMPLAIEITNNAYIFDMPYMIGNNYSNITKCIGIGEFDNYYRVLFNNNDTLACGFVEKADCTIIPYETTEKVKVKATNIKVNLYKYPTTLTHNNNAIINSTIKMHSTLVISKNVFPITIDPYISLDPLTDEKIPKEFYTYENNGEINFIYTADVIPYSDKTIKYLNTENATIKCLTDDTIEVYSSIDGTNVLFELNNSQRIYVEKYDKHSEYTKIIYKDTERETHEGYIKTEFIEMDKLDNSKIILVIIIIASVAILVVIITSYLLIRKKK